MTTTDRPIFIFGCPRSGTSLFSRLLNAHPRIAIPFESHLYHYLYDWRHLFTDLDSATRMRQLMADFLSMEDIKEWRPQPSLEKALRHVERHDFHGMVDGLMTSWARDQGKPRWGEKTPQHAFYWKEIREGFPDMQVLHVVRDGRDVALSYRKAFFGPSHVYPIARRWARFLDTADEMKGALGSDAFLEVRYEDLLSEPETSLRRICDFLEESFPPEMLQSHEAAPEYPTDPRNRKNLRRPIMQSNTEKWRDGMSRRDLRIFEGTAGRHLRSRGYRLATDAEEVSTLEALRYMLLENPPSRIAGMLGNRKSQRISLQRLRIWFRWTFDRI